MAERGYFDHIIDTAQANADIGQRRAIAEMAAKRMEALGGTGPQWAEQLRSDPVAALHMAQQYGGFQEIENQIRYSEAARTATSTRELFDTITGTYGPDAAKNWAAGLTDLEDAETPETFTDPQGVTRFKSGPNVGQPIAPQSALKQSQWNNIKATRDERWDRYQGAADVVGNVAIADVTKPEWERSLIVLSNKLYDSSAVMQGEAQATAEAMMSSMGRFGQWVGGVFKPNANLPVAERRKLQSMILEAADFMLGEAEAELNSWREENTSQYGFKEGSDAYNYTLPGVKQIERFNRARESARGVIEKNDEVLGQNVGLTIKNPHMLKKGITPVDKNYYKHPNGKLFIFNGATQEYDEVN